MKKFFLFYLVAFSLTLSAQNVGIGTTAPHPSAVLEIKDAAKGILIPRLTATERDAVAAPAQGLLVFSTTDSAFYFYYNGWRKLLDSTGGWSTGGNKGTDPSINFIGGIL